VNPQLNIIAMTNPITIPCRNGLLIENIEVNRLMRISIKKNKERIQIRERERARKKPLKSSFFQC